MQTERGRENYRERNREMQIERVERERERNREIHPHGEKCRRERNAQRDRGK